MAITVTVTLPLDDFDRKTLALLLDDATNPPARLVDPPVEKPEPEYVTPSAETAIPEQAPEPEQPDAAPSITEVKELASALLAAGKRAEVVEVLTAVGAKRISEISEDRLAEAADLLRKAG